MVGVDVGERGGLAGIDRVSAEVWVGRGEVIRALREGKDKGKSGEEG